MVQWKEVKGFSGYWVSSTGKVKTDDYNHTGKTKELKIFKNVRGYMACNLMRNKIRKRKTVHQLVAIAFIDNPHGYTQINHVNGIKNDNRVANLEWCNASRNSNHAYEIGLNVAKKGELSQNSKLTDEEVREIRKLRLFGMRLHKIAILYNSTLSNVSLICLNKSRKK